MSLGLLQLSNLLALLVEDAPESALVPLAEEAAVLEVLRVTGSHSLSIETEGENT